MLRSTLVFLPASTLGLWIVPEPVLAVSVTGPLNGSLDWRAMSEYGPEYSPNLNLEFAQQPDPVDDPFLQPVPEPVFPESEADVPEADTELLEELPDESVTPRFPDEEEPSFPISHIEVIGSTIFGPNKIDPIIQPLQGRRVTLEDLRQVADAITQLYLNEGYLTSRAILEEQAVEDGGVQIRVIEGGVTNVLVEGNQHLNSRYIRQRIQLGARVPLRSDQLEDQLRVLRADPLLENVEASLRAGEGLGESILVVRVVEARRLGGEFRVDNYSPPSVGSERTGVALSYQNLTGLGDRLGFSYDRSTQGGVDLLDFNYRVPVNPMNGTLQLRTVIDRNRVVQEPIREFNIEGRSERYEISFRQPLIRSPREELALLAGFSHRRGQTFLLGTPFGFGVGPDEDGTSRVSAVRLGQDYVRRDVQGAWAVRSQFSIGVDLFNATTNEAPIPDSRFFSWLGQGQRVQRIGDRHVFIAQIDTQLTPDRLLPSEQFVIGGGQSLRGYRQNVRAGDNGVRVSLENRVTLARNEAGESIFQLAPFFDMGYVWNTADNPNVLPNQRFLAGLGTGLLWEPIRNLDMRLDFAIPFINLDDRGQNTQDDGIYFSVQYRF